MNRPSSAAIVVASVLFLYSSVARAGGSDALERARSLLSRDDARGAVAVLENELVAGTSDRAGLMDLLRRAYEGAARQAEASGKADEAEFFRDNLEILNHKASPQRRAAPDDAKARPKAVEIDSQPPASEAQKPVEKPRADAGPSPAPVFLASDTSTKPKADDPTPNPSEFDDKPNRKPKPSPVGLDGAVVAADAAFVAKRYDEAGRIYAKLAQDRRLPKSRRDHWAYCRCVDVVRRINAKPKSAAEWDRIDQEIQEIRELSPTNWFGEYLRNRAAERTSGRRTSQSNKVVVRGAAPEETSAERGSDPSAQPSPAATESSDLAPPGESSPPARGGAMIGNWQVRETPNFRILHADPALAERLAQVAESARESQCRRWMGSAPRNPWSPRCDLYVYPNAAIFSRMTGQPEDSPGFSTMGMNSGRIVARRINLRADHPNLLTAIVPHEITHVVLADLFPTQQIPRWADEGMAVLAEPSLEQRTRANDLEKPLASGRLFKVDDLMVMDYPDGKHWSLYYAQSVSLTRFLVEQGTPVQFIRFMQGTQRGGIEAQLRKVYQIDGFADLERRWLSYAKANASAPTAVAEETPKGENRQRR
jgi:hypothetical protein